ncbi:MAG: glycogen/starch/alpha-glucan phosphorylase [Gammaproteobacteria bacterium]|nr:glycogen/starch/alpha-glucan phosphorylase [Gammaproteobacteria bacterium]MCP5423575.1 glycogen/starch/alpha-glucan phosphorylase [Gammaproteobacteria bacterium]
MVDLAKARRLLKRDPLGSDTEAVRDSMAHHLSYTVAKDPITVTARDWFDIVAHSVRDRVTGMWMETMRNHYEQDVKRVYYLSMEFLMGRALNNSLLNMGLAEEYVAVMEELGISHPTVSEIEPDPALGNGGLGRLAACFLDSLACMRLPGYGYGIRYEYGMFHQEIQGGQQIEHPDNWLRFENPWEFPRPEVMYPVHFGGRLVEYTDEFGRIGHDWQASEEVMAMAYDMPIPGYGSNTANNLRLWSAKASRDLDLRHFNEGNYLKAVEDKSQTETLSKVLYPNDTTVMGRELRLRQEYFFVSASLQDIIRRYLSTHDDLHGLPEKVAIQLNDTHPALAIPELLRLLLDPHHLPWDEAWEISTKVFAYTNHTLLPEALETWSVALFEYLLPRHLQIIYEINRRFLKDVSHRYPGDVDRMRRMSLISEDGEKRVRMAHLAVVGSHKVNGVAALHTELLKSRLFADFHDFFPDRIINKTNGITPRRWLNQANPGLSALISQHIGKGWVTDLDDLKKLAPLAQDSAFQAAFAAVKRENKRKLAEYIETEMEISINPDSLFDVQVKRMHEYKRQLLNLLHVIARYNRIRANPDAPVVPRTVIFAGKAAPGYATAKLIIRLINDVGDIINNDPVIGDRLKVVFIPDYDVSHAERIIPAADLSEQISTAGTEASGTGNMKLSLNGALTVGTLDGANIEIRDEVGDENIFIFGLTAPQVEELRQQGYNPWDYYHANPDLKQVLDMIGSGYFSDGDQGRFQPIFDTLTHFGDRYLLLADYASYVACQNHIDSVYLDTAEWMRRAIINVAQMGKFSSDRTIREYAEEVWGITPVA